MAMEPSSQGIAMTTNLCAVKRKYQEGIRILISTKICLPAITIIIISTCAVDISFEAMYFGRAGGWCERVTLIPGKFFCTSNLIDMAVPLPKHDIEQ